MVAGIPALRSSATRSAERRARGPPVAAGAAGPRWPPSAGPAGCLRQRRDEQRRPASVGGGVGVRHLLGQHPARLLGGHRLVGHARDRHHARRDIEPMAPTRRPDAVATAGPGDREPPEAAPRRRCRGGPRAGGQVEQRVSSSALVAADDQRAGQARPPRRSPRTTNPGPRPCGIRFAQRSRRPRGSTTEVVERGAHRLRRRGAARREGRRRRPRPATSTPSPARRLTWTRRRRRTATARARARRSPDRGSRSWRAPAPGPERRGASAACHRRSPLRRGPAPRPRRRRRPRPTRGFGAPAIAQSGSLSPWPVTVHTTVWPGSSSPGSCGLEQPGDARRPRPARRRRPPATASSR